jgi:hypothetical protein
MKSQIADTKQRAIAQLNAINEDVNTNMI